MTQPDLFLWFLPPLVFLCLWLTDSFNLYVFFHIGCVYVTPHVFLWAFFSTFLCHFSDTLIYCLLYFRTLLWLPDELKIWKLSMFQCGFKISFLICSWQTFFFQITDRKKKPAWYSASTETCCDVSWRSKYTLVIHFNSKNLTFYFSCGFCAISAYVFCFFMILWYFMYCFFFRIVFLCIEYLNLF